MVEACRWWKFGVECSVIGYGYDERKQVALLLCSPQASYLKFCRPSFLPTPIIDPNTRSTNLPILPPHPNCDPQRYSNSRAPSSVVHSSFTAGVSCPTGNLSNILVCKPYLGNRSRHRIFGRGGGDGRMVWRRRIGRINSSDPHRASSSRRRDERVCHMGLVVWVKSCWEGAIFRRDARDWLIDKK